MTLIRSLKSEEVPLLEEFLYQAIFVPEGVLPPPRSILADPDLQIYIQDFGRKSDDLALVAEADGRVVGAVWVRLMRDYGYYDDQTPSLSISLLSDYRGRGIGQQLMTAMLDLLQAQGYPRVSLSVSKANPAVRFYQRLGFATVEERADDYLMICELTKD